MSIGSCIVDTNVPIVANGQNKEVCPDCRVRTIDFIEELIANGRLVIDLGGEVENEYWRHLRQGYPGVGNRFIQHFLSARVDRVDRVDLGHEEKDRPEICDFSNALKRFDKSDRKFAALSRATGRPVYVSVDTDWAIFSDALEATGVNVVFVCGKNQKDWFFK